MSHNPDSRTLSLLHAILEDLKSQPQPTRVSNAGTINIMRELLSQEDYVKIAPHVNDASDARNLLDFVLYLLSNGLLSRPGEDLKTNGRARRLLLKVASTMPIIPRSLFMKGVTVHDYIGRGGFGHVSKGKLGGALVALKYLHKNAPHNYFDFCREALTWRSLNHKFVLPLLGIYEDQNASQLFLVSPYMKNGTLAQWRKTAKPPTNVIEERMLEVAQGIQYIHSEGVVHGDLRGDNVLLDSNFHVQIADFGLTRHLEATVTKSGALHHNFAAPELFGDGDAEDDAEDDDQSMARTQQSDVYAFGCLYYEIHYDAVPFARLNEIQIFTKVVLRRERPPRLEVPSLSDGAWKLMQDCWKEKTTRPAIEDVVERMMIWETLQGSGLTQHSCVKNEWALSNGLSDVALTPGALKPPIAPSMFDKQARIKKRLYRDRACFVLVEVVFLLISFYILSSFILTSLADLSFLIPRFWGAPVQNAISCGGPFPPANDWQNEAFRPKHWGLFGEPAPITFRTTRGRMSHRVMVVDIDKRDIEIRVWLDGDDRGYRDVDLDPTVDCGDDISKCLGLGFGAAVVVAPPGRHTIKAEIRKRNESESFVWGKERQRRIKWVMQPCT